MIRILCVIKADEEPTRTTNWVRYKYSEELFDWFYDRLKFFSEDDLTWLRCDAKVLDLECTKRDHANNGCRIYFADGSGYIKFYDASFLIELTIEEWDIIYYQIADREPTIEDIVNFFYKHKYK